jgi:hypothetical protein
MRKSTRYQLFIFRSDCKMKRCLSSAGVLLSSCIQTLIYEAPQTIGIAYTRR